MFRKDDIQVYFLIFMLLAAFYYIFIDDSPTSAICEEWNSECGRPGRYGE